MRYLFNSPTSWAFDMSFILYGALFMMAGAYTLSKGNTFVVILCIKDGVPQLRPRLT